MFSRPSSRILISLVSLAVISRTYGAQEQKLIQGTVIEKPNWNVEQAAEKVYHASKGLGTTEADITDVVCSINNNQRQSLRKKYLAMYSEDLMDRLKSELSGRFLDVIIGLMTPRDEYLADWLHWSLKGVGTEEDTLIEVLCGRTNDEIDRIKAAYKIKYGRNLDDDIESDLSGQLLKLIRAVLAHGRDESGTVDKDLAKTDAQELFDAAKWGTDESKFNAILGTRSYPHLRQVFKIYKELSGADITETIIKSSKDFEIFKELGIPASTDLAIQSEVVGDIQAALLAIVAAVRDPVTYYATKLHNALAGAGTGDNNLIGIIVTRSEVDLKNIKEAFAAKYGVSLADRVSADTSGDYGDALLKIIG